MARFTSFSVINRELEDVLQSEDSEEIERRLKDFPVDLMSLYRTMIVRLERSDNDSKTLAVEVLSWLYCSHDKESLTESQLKKALILRGVGYSHDIPRAAILKACQGLVMITYGYAHFLHSDFHEYLAIHPPSRLLSREEIAETCLESFNYIESQPQNSEEIHETPHQLRKLSFQAHAARFWAKYASEIIDNSPLLQQKVLRFLLSENIRSDVIHILATTRDNDTGQGLQPPLNTFVSGQTPLQILVYNGLNSMALLILNSGPHLLEMLRLRDIEMEEDVSILNDTSSRDIDGQTLVHYIAFSSSTNHQLLDAIFGSTTINVNAKSNRGHTALHCCAYSGNQEVLEVLLREGSNPVEGDESGLTALHFAAAQGHLDIVKILCQNGGDLSATDNHGLNPLHYATSYGRVSVMKYILEQQPELKDVGSVSPLHKAVEYFQFEAMKHLVSINADVMSQANVKLFGLDNVTPLEVAIRLGQMEQAEELIISGAYLRIDRNFLHTQDRWAKLTDKSFQFWSDVLNKYPGPQAPERWGREEKCSGKPLTVEQLIHLRERDPRHPVPTLLLAKWHSDEGNKKYDEACKFFDSFCSVQPLEGQLLDWSPETLAPEVFRIVHMNIRCNGCRMYPLRGLRYKCMKCPRYDLCCRCIKERMEHRVDHPLIRIPTTAWLESNNIPISEEISVDSFNMHV